MQRTLLPRMLLLLVTTLVLGCAGNRPRANLDLVGGAVSPSEEQSRSLIEDRTQTGTASYYHRALQGRRTASGGRYDSRALTAAHRTFAFGTRLRVTNLTNARSVVVTVTDRGPYAVGRIIDLSRRAARVLGLIQTGTAPVRLEPLT
jgi:rare lipoprotein A